MGRSRRSLNKSFITGTSPQNVWQTGSVLFSNYGLELSEYLAEAVKLKDTIMEICNHEANHPAVQHFQNTNSGQY
ncbi:MAG: hypothetical protein A2020_01820 [Lentisphaerae bacterium GWF2_45_14]|nr:MAG: hypothetical protein A2020_01820 [Lentisphaerae bacterium GWF2_45_14]